MAGNSFGQAFRITSCGESHGGAVAVIVDGCPSGLELDEVYIQIELDRRRPGQSSITSPRKESDTIHILSGIFEGVTTGTPILLLAYNQDFQPQDYEKLKNLYRPSHADYTYLIKYGIRDTRGSGRASARETLARVAAGAIARKYLARELGISITAYVEQVGSIVANIDMDLVTRESVDANIIRCPDKSVAPKMISLVEEVKSMGDSIGGVVKCVIKNVPVGLGEPVFDKLHADLAHAMLGINAVKGFEIGSGFHGASLRGSEQNDRFVVKDGKVTTASNNSGGVQGGISNGEDIYFRVAFKPVSTIKLEQETLNLNNEVVTFSGDGRHDPCVLPRAVPVVEAMAALVLMDHYLRC